MKSEKPKFKKDMEPNPIPREESDAWRAAFDGIAARGKCEDILRRKIVRKILDITGRKVDYKHSLDRACAYMVEKGYLVPPAWMVRIKPWFSLFSTEELCEAYGKLSEEFVEPF